MSEFFAKSGAKVVISLASWQDAKALLSAIQKEVAARGITIDRDMDISVLVAAALSVDSSDAVQNALYKCSLRCLRNNEKITMATFDDGDARKDYYEIMFAVMKENLAPLWDGLFAMLPESLKAMVKKADENQTIQ